MLAMQQRLTRPFYALLSLPSTAMGFALSVQISALSWILTTKYGLDIHDVGLVWAAGPIAGILGQVIIGALSDKVWLWNGRRRPFILIGGVLASLSLLALPSIDVISDSLGIEGILGVAIAIALMLDLSINISFNPTRSIIADVTPAGHERTRGYTWMQTISGSFGVGAYAIGTWFDNYILIYTGVVLVLLLSVIPPLLVEEPKTLSQGTDKDDAAHISFIDGLQVIRPLWGFLLYSVYALLIRILGIEVEGYAMEWGCVVLTLALLWRTLSKDESGHRSDAIGFQKVLAAHAFTWLGVQSMFVYMIAFVQQNLPELSDGETGRVIAMSFFVLSLVAAILPVLVLEPMAKRFGRVRVHIFSIASMGIAYLLLSQLGGSVLNIYALMAVLGIGWAATVSLPFAIMSQKVSAHKMGLFMGLFNLSVVLPQLVSSMGIGKVLMMLEDKNGLFVICGVSLLISALAWTRVSEQSGN